MIRNLLVALAVLVGSAAAVAVVFVVGMRRHSPTVRRLVRGFARRVVNPRMLRTAGTPGSRTSVVHHVGRVTGRDHRTPVVAEPTDDGFVVALPYGTTSNRVRNVLAAGSAVVVRDGVTHRVHDPEVVPLAEVADLFPAADRRTFARFRLDECMLMRVERHPAPAGGG